MTIILTLQKANNTKSILQNTKKDQIDAILSSYSEALISHTKEILDENAKDLVKMAKENPKYDRLLLNKERISSIARDVKKIADYEFETYKLLDEKIGTDGIRIQKISAPLGTVGMIYESRPNVTVDAVSLCLKSKNVCILKGSSDAHHTNTMLVNIAHNILKNTNVPIEAVTLLEPKHDIALQLITARGFVDLCIPRGSKNLINFVLQNATIPIIETGAGVVHIYIDESFDLQMAQNVVFNSKARRPSVCNSLDCLVISEKSLPYLSNIITPLLEIGTEIFCDNISFKEIHHINSIKIKQAQNEDYGCEFLSLKLAIKVVKNIDDAINFINEKSSKHTECIITNNINHAEMFLKEIDSAVVLHNASTNFTDGGCFGMISEIGISTQKLHARGPFGLDNLLTYKWIVHGNGQVRK